MSALFAVASLALVLFMVPSAAFADAAQNAASSESEHINGYIPVSKNVHRVPAKRGVLRAPAATDLPSAYRSDEQPWAQGIKVKNQYPTGLCWAFSMTSAAEYSYAKESYETTGAVSETSPGQLGYFMYNRVNDPLGNTGGDKNGIAGTDPWYDFGGNPIYAMQHLATWSGLSSETLAPFSNVINKTNYADSLAYDDYLTQQESIWYSAMEVEHAEAVAAIKGLVYDYGAVSTAIYMDTNRFMNFTETKPGTQTAYSDGRSFFDYTGGDTTDHAVTIIGWDDAYPKENFTHERNKSGGQLTDAKGSKLSDEAARETTTPEHDGAWIIQNSWGSNSHEDGFFYMSYESYGAACGGDAYAFDMQPANTYRYNFQYDGTADCGDASDTGNEDFMTAEGTKAANVYTNTTDAPVTLDAVGFTTFNDGATVYDISVYTGLTNAQDPASGILAGSTRATITTSGCKTAVLDKPVTIGAGEHFSIVLAFADETYFGVEKSRTNYPFTYEVQVDPGQSFFMASGSNTWHDMYDFGACFRIKGFANAVSEPSAVTYTVTFEDGLGGTIASYSVESGQDAQTPANPERDGYLFDGWNADFSNVTENLVVVAQWKKIVPVPVAATDLVYNGQTQVGVAAGEGYALEGVTEAVEAGNYTATAILAEGYVWNDGTCEPKELPWYIAPKQASVEPAVAAAAAVKVRTVKVAKGTALTVSKASSTSAKVTWKKAAGAKSYQLQWRVRGGSWKTVTSAKLKVTVKKLKKGKLYEFRVRGVAGNVKGAWSTVQRCYFRAVSSLKAVKVKKGVVKATWKKDSKANKGYRVYVSYSKNGTAVKTKTISAKKKIATIKGLKKGKKVWVKVVPLRKAGGKVYTGLSKVYSKSVKV